MQLADIKLEANNKLGNIHVLMAPGPLSGDREAGELSGADDGAPLESTPLLAAANDG